MQHGASVPDFEDLTTGVIRGRVNIEKIYKPLTKKGVYAMKNIYRIFIGASLIMVSIMFLMTHTILAKELPILVDITELSEAYDGKRVAVFAWARSAQHMRGRLGSEYAKTEIGKFVKQKKEQTADEYTSVTVIVFSDFPPYNVVNNRVIVQGIYRHRGRYAGFLADHFIIADQIIRDWNQKE